MAKHSKWSKVKNYKGAADAKRGAVFTRLGRAITVAVRDGGADPEFNFRLRSAIDQALAGNMPKDNIERAIKKGTGEIASDQIDEVTYEGYGPGGAAVLVEALTDNRHRTSGNIKHAFSAHGGNLGATGSVQWIFEKCDGEWSAKYPLTLDDAQKESLTALLEALDDDEDVSAVFTNADL